MKNLYYTGIIIGCIMLLVTCQQNTTYQQSYEINNRQWHKDSVLSFKPKIQDTINAQTVYFNIRHTANYPYRNIIFFVTLKSPTHRKVTDTVEFYIADKDGKWKGSGLGDIYDTQLIYKKNIRFPNSGQYTFNIVHGMRETKLPEILDVGLTIQPID